MERHERRRAVMSDVNHGPWGIDQKRFSDGWNLQSRRRTVGEKRHFSWKKHLLIFPGSLGPETDENQDELRRIHFQLFYQT